MTGLTLIKFAQNGLILVVLILSGCKINEPYRPPSIASMEPVANLVLPKNSLPNGDSVSGGMPTDIFVYIDSLDEFGCSSGPIPKVLPDVVDEHNKIVVPAGKDLLIKVGSYRVNENGASCFVTFSTKLESSATYEAVFSVDGDMCYAGVQRRTLDPDKRYPAMFTDLKKRIFNAGYCRKNVEMPD